MLPPRDAITVALGRQALSLAARVLRDAGRRTVLVPAYCCQTMVTPWELEGMAVDRVPVGPDLLMSADELARRVRYRLDRGEIPAVLHCETFGVRAGTSLRSVLDGAAAGGVPVVVDRTHSFLGGRGEPGWIEVVSTRKLFALPEVGWICGLPRGEDDGRQPRGRLDDRLTRAREQFLAEPGVDSFEAAEDLADEAWTPVPPHPDALSALSGLDTEKFARRILKTRRRVAERVPRLDVVNPGAVCPLVIRDPHADELADELFRHGMVGPIHWDRPEHLPAGAAWPERILCLPTVLDESQVELVAEVLSP
ncbi:hypothetical protein [Acidipropionibacterium virtanenii]|uniref:DegT/DnrJ/EryC1/StrS aminotransferase family protein n=1 Tax=Acidipropionibacterium virtanenii TaxID=2057246 RepID=A0A344USI1_9ACTN|nr:hypothetical protein [Acidipropionibacterium virtanenii]AXE38229.1 hypothetical protein JS278_01046 [Acidipropionibacterium virtanenii]